jgi:hypothetical protein
MDWWNGGLMDWWNGGLMDWWNESDADPNDDDRATDN